MNPTTDARPLVLLVDDRPDNLLALEAVLQPLELRLRRAASGEQALREVLREEPTLIVMDVQMPGLDGFETARHILERERTSHIPIIFLTAISRELEHQLRGYDLGAVDYVAKPFDPDVLRAKVRVLVEHSQLRRTIADQAEQLADRLEERDRAQAALARQTHELERSNAELERFAGAAARALRDPLLTVVGFLDLLGAESPGELVDAARRGVARSIGVLDSLERYASVAADPIEGERVDLGAVLGEVVDARKELLDAIGATVGCDPMPAVQGDRWQLVQLFGELVDNAIAFRDDVPLRVHVSVSRRGDDTAITVRDNGTGIPVDDLPRVFTVFARPWGAGDRAGAGLGLATCRRIVERHGGRIWAESGPDRGTAVSFTLPMAS
jgi:signal transduction histidine kinase